MCWEGPIGSGDPHSCHQEEAGRSARSLKKQVHLQSLQRVGVAREERTGTRWQALLCAPTRFQSAAAGPTRQVQPRACHPPHGFTRTVYMQDPGTRLFSPLSRQGT